MLLFHPFVQITWYSENHVYLVAFSVPIHLIDALEIMIHALSCQQQIKTTFMKKLPAPYM